MIKSLTSLRGIFILFIFFHHCLGNYPGGGSMGTTFFFVLGGFSMALGYKDRVCQFDFSYRKYLTRRIIKFYPLHWMCLLAAVPFIMMSFNMKQVPVFLINAALLQTLIPIKEIYFSFNAVSWYLADTMIFAIVFPFVFKWINSKSKSGRFIIAVSIAILYVIMAVFLPNDYRHAFLYISPFVRITDFIFGIFLALGYLKFQESGNKEKLRNGTVYQVMVLVFVALLLVESVALPSTYRIMAPVYWPLVAITVLLASLSDRNGGGILLENKIFQKLGELSFTIFLTHQLIIRYNSILFEKILHLDKNIIFVIFTLLLTIVVSYLVERFIITPITQWLTKKIQPSMTAP